MKDITHNLTVTTAPLDVSSPDSITQWAQSLASSHQIDHVDVIINNAGIYGDRVNLDTVTADGMVDVYKTNAIGPLLIVQQLRKNNLLGGRSDAPPSLIVNVTSKVGSIDDNQSGGGYSYRSSKIALNIITKSLSIDLANENVNATLVHPGWVKTDMVNNNGLISAQQSVEGIVGVLESKSDDELRGQWYDWKNEVIPW